MVSIAASVRRARTAVTGLALLAIVCVGGQAQARDVLVFAAASQRDALEVVMAAWTKGGGGTAKASYESSSTLARQIEQGAPADLFISANETWMDYVAARKLIDPATRVDLLGNTLVLVGPKGVAPVAIAKGFDLATLLGDGRLAMGDPDHVPAGIYGKAALTSLGVWTVVEPKVARAANVRAALALVARGETPLGVVYGSDAAADATVAVAGTFPADSHPPIVYPAAVLAASGEPEAAKKLMAFLKTPEASRIFASYGFTALD